MPFSLIASTGPSATDYTAARAALIDRLALLAAGGAGELTAAGAALIPRLALLAAGGAGELTAARATLISNLDALISSRLGSIKTIQSGTITIAAGATTTTVAITSVDATKSIILNLGQHGDAVANPDANARIALSAGNEISAVRNQSTLSVTTGWRVIEFN